MLRSPSTVLVLLVVLLSPAVLAQEDAVPEQAAFFGDARLPAAGRQSTLLNVPRFGRYAVLVESTQGTGLQLVDRMAGPGPVVGGAGSEDGRLDVFLDRGEYKVVTHGHPMATGEVALMVHAFGEQQDEPLQIVERKLISTRLGDFEQVSWWIHVEKRRPVSFQAGGRHLRDLRLWQGGQWLVDARPQLRTVTPRAGQPLLLCELHAELEPGLYRLTAYGGVSQEWAEDSGERPLHLRFGFPELAEAERRRHVVGPLGFDSFLVPGVADYFRIEVSEARPIAFDVHFFDAASPFGQAGQQAEISKESLPPVADLRASRDANRLHLVTVTAEAGQPYVLQHFESKESYSFSHGGRYWISTIHSGHPSDSVDATAILVEYPHHGRPRPARDQVVRVAGDGWLRRANLLDVLTVYLRIDDGGDYEVLGSGDAEAVFRVEPFLINRPPKYEPPPWRGPGSVWELDAGFYVMTVKPEKKGIAEIGIRPRGLFDGVREAVGLEKDQPHAEPVDASIRFGPVSLNSENSYHLYVNRQPEVRAGLVLRSLPLRLAHALPLAQKPGDLVTVEGFVEERSLLRAVAEDGAFLEVSVDGGPWSPEAWIEKGTYEVKVRHDRSETTVYSLEARPERFLTETPLPPVPAETMAALPDFPVLTDRKEQFFDLDRNQGTTYLVAADEPALYQLETTGLLATEGNLRTRVVTSLSRQSENGVGRNFLVQRYLREGDYQITVGARGRTAGHLGLRLRRTAVQDGGLLSDGIPGRAFLPAGEAIAYRFRVEEEGMYQLRSIGVGRTFRARLEDADGWPIREPALAADFRQSLEPGEYRLIVLPESVPARQLTLVERVRNTLSYAGHGPHELPLDVLLRHRWEEDPTTEERPADVFVFELPAMADVEVTLTEEMQADVVHINGTKDGPDRTKAAYVPPERGFSGRLDAGRYELRVTSFRVNNQVDYQLRVSPRQLVAGLTREVSAPSRTAVAVGEGGRLAELSSFGSADVRAALYDAAGRRVAASDDRPGDWNFALTERLPAGHYVLAVDPVGSGGTTTRVTLKHPEERRGDAVAAGAALTLDVGRVVETRPLELPAGAEAVVLTARSSETVGLSLEEGDGDGWRTVGSRIGRDVRLELFGVREDTTYRLRVWSLDQRGNPVELRTAAGAVRRVTEAELASGLRPEAFGGTDTGLVLVEPERPGCFSLNVEEGVRAIALSGESSARLAEPVDGPVSGDRVLLSADLSAGGRTLRWERMVVGREPLLVRLPAGARVHCDVGGGDGVVGRGGLVVARARTTVGAPGLALDGGPMAPAPPSALAASLGGSTVTAWVGDGGDLEARLEAWRLPLADAEVAGWGSVGGELADGSRTFDLPAGEKRLRLVLDPGIAAVLADADGVRSVHWTPRPHEEVLETTAARLVVAALPGVTQPGGGGHWRADVLPVDERRRLGPVDERSFERQLTTAGLLRLPVGSPDEGMTLHVRGADAIFVSGRGTIRRGADVPADGGGTLLVHHGPGVVRAWLSELPGDPPETVEVGSAPVAEVGEGLGAEVLLAAGETRFFRFTVAAAGSVGLGVRADADVVDMALLAADGRVLGRGVVQMHRLEPGSYLLQLRAPADGPPLVARPVVIGLERPSTGPPDDVVRRYLR